MEELIHSLFNKGLYDLDIADLSNFFAEEQDENDLMEFKSGDLNNFDSICKEVVAFLNTNGGLVFIGTPNEQKKTIGNSQIKYCQGDLVLSKWKSKEQILQKILTGIAPPPTTVKVHGINEETGNFFVIAVNRSVTPPHQVLKSGVYYIRMERDSRPAPHGLVEALFRQRQKPNLNFTTSIEKLGAFRKKIIVTITNDSEYPDERYNINIKLKNILSDSDENDQTVSQFFDESLVFGMKKQMSFEIEHWEAPILYSCMIWSKDTPLKTKHVVYDPIQQSVVEEINLDEGNENLQEIFLNHLVDNLLKKYDPIYFRFKEKWTDYKYSTKLLQDKLPFKIISKGHYGDEIVEYKINDDNYFRITWFTREVTTIEDSNGKGMMNYLPAIYETIAYEAKIQVAINGELILDETLREATS